MDSVFERSEFEPRLYMSGLNSQYDGVNIEQSTIGYGWRKNQEAKLKIVGRVTPWSKQQDLDQTSSYINNICNCVLTFSIVWYNPKVK